MYQAKCRYFHPSGDKCDKKCISKNCMKRHIKPCRYGQICKKIEKCAYKHTDSQSHSIQASTIEALEKKVKDLLEYKCKSEAQIEVLKKEMNTLNSQKSSKTPLANLHDAASQVGKLQNEFKLLKSEFYLLQGDFFDWSYLKS